ncbi:phage regulatory CII family protein (plasmid) [Halodesulfovibrio aestuarii]|uniref:Uncharacterized protein n=1 Tax=Halodesulfovibrio aestuarii TaxID=126333 RepID=A0A8G2F945_9BACT|nr:phage regulatory CII family protein [Halodesulfovibrio aestuarii]SHJ72624.1 hypothetical protein SAMN05660830_03095 [Halodesulfovibrio aestuarii]
MAGKKSSQYSNLTEACHDTLTSRGKTNQLAKRLGRTPTTLSQQLNPNVDYTHFDADNVLPAMEEANDDTPLHWLAEQRGYLCVHVVPAGSDCKLEFELMKSSKEFADVVCTYNDIMADGVVDQEESVRFRKEAREAAAQLLAMADAVDAAVDLPKEEVPSSLPRMSGTPTDREQ